MYTCDRVFDTLEVFLELWKKFKVLKENSLSLEFQFLSLITNTMCWSQEANLITINTSVCVDDFIHDSNQFCKLYEWSCWLWLWMKILLINKWLYFMYSEVNEIEKKTLAIRYTYLIEYFLTKLAKQFHSVPTLITNGVVKTLIGCFSSEMKIWDVNGRNVRAKQDH